METIETYLHNLYRVQPDFVYSVSRDFVRACQTPMLVMPDDTPAHPYQTSIDIASLAPNAEVTVYPWKEPPELKARTINGWRIPEGASASDSGPLERPGCGMRLAEEAIIWRVSPVDRGARRQRAGKIKVNKRFVEVTPRCPRIEARSGYA